MFNSDQTKKVQLKVREQFSFSKAKRKIPGKSGKSQIIPTNETWNHRDCQLSGMVGDKSGKLGVFLLSWCAPNFNDDWQSFTMYENFNFHCLGHW